MIKAELRLETQSCTHVTGSNGRAFSGTLFKGAQKPWEPCDGEIPWGYSWLGGYRDADEIKVNVQMNRPCVKWSHLLHLNLLWGWTVSHWGTWPLAITQKLWRQAFRQSGLDAEEIPGGQKMLEDHIQFLLILKNMYPHPGTLPAPICKTVQKPPRNPDTDWGLRQKPVSSTQELGFGTSFPPERQLLAGYCE